MVDTISLALIIVAVVAGPLKSQVWPSNSGRATNGPSTVCRLLSGVDQLLPRSTLPLIVALVTPASAHAVGSGGWKTSAPSALSPA